jgi:hypothetical protein
LEKSYTAGWTPGARSTPRGIPLQGVEAEFGAVIKAGRFVDAGAATIGP